MEPRSKCFALPRISGRTVPVTGHSSSMLYPSRREGGRGRMGNVKHEMADVSGINGSQEIHKIHSKSEADRIRVGGRGGTYLLPRTCCTGQIQLKCWCRAGKQLPPDPYRRPLSDMCAVWPIKELFAGTVRGKWQSGKAGGRWHTVGGRWQVAGNMGQSECCIYSFKEHSHLAFIKSHMQRKNEIIRL